MSSAPVSFCRSVAIVDELPTRTAVWHVDVNGEIPPRTSRLTGAWILDNTDTATLRTLLTDRHIVRCAPATETSIVEQFTIAGWIDLDDTIDAVHTEIRNLDKQFDEHAITKKTKLVRPVWPEVPDPRTVALPPVAGPTAPPSEGARALDLARGIRNLANAWSQLEAQRLTRRFLIEPAGTSVRALPLVSR